MIFRVLFVKFPHLTQNIRFNLAKCIHWTGCLLSLVATVGHMVEYFVWLEPTMMAGYNFMRTLEPRLENSSGGIFDKVAILTILAINVIEFVCYIVLFTELYAHHERHVR